jgi:hypothetical protein
VLAGVKQSFEPIEPSAPKLTVPGDPVSCRLDSMRLQVKLMLPARDPARDEARSLQYREVFGDLRWRLCEGSRERGYSLVALLTETREKPSPSRVAEREEDFVELRVVRALSPSFSGTLFARVVPSLSVHHMVYCYPTASAFSSSRCCRPTALVFAILMIASRASAPRRRRLRSRSCGLR